jgi:hypothetical protein
VAAQPAGQFAVAQILIVLNWESDRQCRKFARKTSSWIQIRRHARTVLHASPWLAPMTKELGVRVFDVTSIVAAC